ncbi:short chain dehydrogenase [Alcanivorax nanhaiticus]|uniref:Short chain dehydrogenase n=1 Tax=Alcanivorax nanhaiticus TaxID=1177154 RepID=A0A095UNG6_9GAMM|nr:SDR family oxidoreductase [Alcanivorax nanhaiticus]KGD64040.1 short chain dehydrogenase [Alcanivorax nanhaiticus]
MSIKLNGAVTCVTGAARGIGFATAKALADRGALVVVGDIDETEAQKAADTIGRGAMAVRVDVADPASFTHFIEQAKSLGPIALLVNNAGIQRTGRFIDQPLDSQHREIAINLSGVISGMRLVLPDMLAADYGHIVNVASMSAKMTLPGVAVYTASKFGVASLSRSVRAEIVDSNVTITTVMPSAVQTELAAGLNIRGVPKASPEEVAEEIVASCLHCKGEITVPRWLTPVKAIEEVLPEKVGSFLKKLAGAQERLLHDTPASRAYQERVSKH